MIRQFDVYPNPSRRGREERPFVVVLQSGFISSVATQLCAPLVADSEFRPEKTLNPVFEILGRKLHFHPVEIAPIPARLLESRIDNLERHRDRIIPAIDLVFTGI